MRTKQFESTKFNFTYACGFISYSYNILADNFFLEYIYIIY